MDNKYGCHGKLTIGNRRCANTICSIVIVGIIMLSLALIATFCSGAWGEELNKCDRLNIKHAWKDIAIFGGANIDGISGFKDSRYQRCLNCGMYKLRLLVERYKYWDSADKQDHSFSWFAGEIEKIKFVEEDK